MDSSSRSLHTLELYNKPVNKFVAGFIGSPPMNFVTGLIKAEKRSMYFTDGNGQVSLEVAQPHRAALEKYTGKKVYLGIRPESFIDNPTQQAAPGRSITAVVEVVEPMGSEIYLYLDVAGHTVTARIDTTSEPPVNKARVLDVDMAKATISTRTPRRPYCGRYEARCSFKEGRYAYLSKPAFILYASNKVYSAIAFFCSPQRLEDTRKLKIHSNGYSLFVSSSLCVKKKKVFLLKEFNIYLCLYS